MTANASKEPASGAMTALIVFKVHFVMLSLFTIFPSLRSGNIGCGSAKQSKLCFALTFHYICSQIQDVDLIHFVFRNPKMQNERQTALIYRHLCQTLIS